MKKVNFTEMKNGSKEDYELLEKYEKILNVRQRIDCSNILQVKLQLLRVIK